MDTPGFVQACVWAKTNCNKISAIIATQLCKDEADDIVKIGTEEHDNIVQLQQAKLAKRTRAKRKLRGK